MRRTLLHFWINMSHCMSCLLHNFAAFCFLHSEWMHILRLILFHIFAPYLQTKATKASTCPPFQFASARAACATWRIWMWHMWKRPVPWQICCLPWFSILSILSILSLCLDNFRYVALENDESYGSRKLLSLKFMFVLVSSFAMCIPYL